MSPLNRQDLTRKIQSLTDLTPDEKSSLLELLNTRKKYGLVWEDKPEKVEEELRTQFPVLTEVDDRRIVGPEGSPNHVLIEGDNLHALTALQYTHEGKVDVIYIDPPYNTGNKDFVYNDHFVDKEDQWRHSNWLSFMEKRLKLAKLLLKETGVIFISIDDNEQAQLRLLCDEVFGRENFRANILWQKVYSPRMDDDGISVAHDFISVYSKSASYVPSRMPFEQNTKQFSGEDEATGFRYRPRSLRKEGKNSLRTDRPNLFYPIKDPDNQDCWPIKADGSEGCWRMAMPKYTRLLKAGTIEWVKVKEKWQPYVKQYLDSNATKPYVTFWPHSEVGHNHSAVDELKEVFGRPVFSNPKPLALLKRVMEVGQGFQSPSNDEVSDDEWTILDFFAGSGTTLHATMALNAEDGGTRQCILVTNNENNICEEVTYERNRRVIQGYTNAKGAAVTGLGNNSLRYYKTAFVDRARSQKNRRDLTRASVDLLCLKEDSYTERSDLATADRRVFDGPEHLLFVVFEPETIPDTVEVIAREPKHSKVYVFSPGSYAWDDDFEEVRHKITLCALPEALIQAFQKVMPAEGELARYDDAPDAGLEVGE